jgi:hypothetical protein
MANDPARKRRQGRGLIRAALAVPVAVLVCACSQDMPSVLTVETNILPANYRAEILAYLRNYLNDPTGVRDAAIGEPELRTLPATQTASATQRYMVCVRYNAKDSTGKYQGSRDYQVAFLSGRLDTLVPVRGEQCAKANWQPFPELEKLRR